MARGFAHERIAAERPFWAAVDRVDAVDLHVDHALSDGADEEVRHLAVSLDIERLLGDGTFVGQARDALRALDTPPDLALIPTHAATTALTALIQSVWDVPVHQITLGPLSTERRERRSRAPQTCSSSTTWP